MLIIK
ncbi:hypothetical protein CGLO_00303 [Colletotrichum gloeosporioides Cg-14]|jgi:Xaa-Pro dipeptidase